MRAKYALALAGFGVLLSSTLPTVAAGDLNRDVARMLRDNSGRAVVLTQPAVVANTACGPAVVGTSVTVPTATVAVDTVEGSPMLDVRESMTDYIREIPAVLAPTSTGVAIISEIPSDVDIRREDLARRISDAQAAGLLDSVRAAEMQTALGQVASAEIQMRADGLLDYKESKRLYRAMTRIGSDVDYYTRKDSTNLLGVRLVPGPYMPAL